MKFKNIDVVDYSYVYTIRIMIENITAEEARQVMSLLDKNIRIVEDK